MSENTTESSRQHRLEEIIAGVLQVVERGEMPILDSLLAQNPDLAEELRSFFADDERMRKAAGLTLLPGLQKTLTEGNLSKPDAALDVVHYFGDYELQEEIARGGMGIVYRARQVSLDRPVALKMILAGSLASQADVQRFQRESTAAAQLEHPNIVPIYEVGEHHGQHYFSMAFIEGGSLADRLAQGPLPPREAAEIVRTIALAIQFAHDHGVIHRDLKPANILMDQAGTPRITDFGLAKRTQKPDGLTTAGAIVGTPGYAAPEQAAGKTNLVGPLADVYGLGAVLYALLTGRPPFAAATPLETFLQALDREPVRPSRLNPQTPPDLETICLKCLEKAPEGRYLSARELADDLDRFLRQEPIRARRASRGRRLWAWSLRHPWVLTTSATLLGILALAVAYGLTMGLRQRNWYALLLEARLERLSGRTEEAWSRLQQAKHIQPDARLYDESLELLIAEGKTAQRLPAVAEAARSLIDVTSDHGPFQTFQTTRDGRLFLIGGKSLHKVIEATSGRIRKEIKTEVAALDPSGRRLAYVAGDRFDLHLHLWDLQTDREQAVIPVSSKLEEEVSQLSFSPDGSQLAWARTCEHWSTEGVIPPFPDLSGNDPRKFVQLLEAYQVKLHEHDQVATAQVWTWDFTKPPVELKQRLKIGRRQQSVLSLSRDGSVLIACGMEETLVARPPTGELSSLPQELNHIRAALHPDGTLLARLDRHTGSVAIEGLAAQQPALELLPEKFAENAPWFRRARLYREASRPQRWLAFSFDGRLLMVQGVNYGSGPSRDHVQIWDAASGQQYLRLPGQGFATPAGHDDSLVTVRGMDKENNHLEIILWDLGATRRALEEAGCLGLMSMLPEERRVGQRLPYPLDRLEDRGGVAAWFANLSPLLPLLLVMGWSSLASVLTKPRPLRRAVLLFATLVLAVVLPLLPAQVYYGLLPFIMIVAWECLRSLKHNAATGQLTPGWLLAGFAAIGVINVLSALYLLATLLGTPGWTVEGLIPEACLEIVYLMIGVQTIEVVVRCLHVQVHGVIVSEESEGIDTFGEVLLDATSKLFRPLVPYFFGLLAIGFIVLKVIDAIKEKKLPSVGVMVVMVLALVWAMILLLPSKPEKESPSPTTDSAAGDTATEARG